MRSVKFETYARARVGPTGMNKTETEYAGRLEINKIGGSIHAYRFEAVKFRIGSACFYTPDFEVVTCDGYLEYHEVKGFWDPKARVKIKAAASMFPDRLFVAVMKIPKKQGGGWTREEIKP